MKKLVSLFLLIFAANLPLIVFGQQFSGGEGTQEQPYLISTPEDWETFANCINGDETNAAYTDKYYQLAGNLTIGSEEQPLSTGVGTGTEKSPGNLFQGHFDGGGYTLTVHINSNADNAAPFSIVRNANFCNIHVEGTITSNKKYAAGLVGIAFGTVNIHNCTSSIMIISNTDGDGTHAGFVGKNMENGTINFENCVFDGSITGPNTIKCAGFAGWRCNIIHYTNCIQAGTIDVKSTTATFHRGKNNNCSFTNAYYINDYTINGEPRQGEPALNQNPEGLISKKVLTVGETSYYVPSATITGIHPSYAYLGQPIVIEPTVTYYGTLLTKNTDYTMSIESVSNTKNQLPGNAINEVGYFVVTLTGLGDYVGSQSFPVTVMDDDNSWCVLQTLLDNCEAGGTITLDKDYVAIYNDNPLEVAGTLTLDLNGHTIDRFLSTEKSNGYVMLVKPEACLTIVDNSESSLGTITGGYNHGNGGGIYNQGTLFLNSGNISGNRCIRIVNTNIFGTGGGIYCAEGSSFSMTGGYVINNTADGGGGGIHTVANSTLTIDGGTISGNTANSKGGGIRVGSDNAVISNCQIYNNNINANGSAKHGGGIYFDASAANSMLTLNNCTIIGNQGSGEGGGFFSIKGTTIANGCTIINNLSGSHRNDICLYSNSTFFLNLEGCHSKSEEEPIILVQQKAQLITDTEVTATVEKEINAYNANVETANGWNLIALPVAEEYTPNAPMTSHTYDLYRLNPANTMWENYKSEDHTDFTTLVNGNGYLYANSAKTTLKFEGTVKTYDENNYIELEEGYNLIGNPYTFNTYINRPYFRMNNSGTALEAVEGNVPIEPSTGIVVETTQANDQVLFTNQAPTQSQGNLTIALSQTDTGCKGIIDNAIISFDAGNQLGKFLFGRERASISIPQDGKDYAIAFSDKQGEMPINLQVVENGTYTLTVSPSLNSKFLILNYLHLIDNMTGADIDLLPSLRGEQINPQVAYTFTAKTTDYASRFKLVFNANENDNDNEPIAYINNGEIIVNGTGTIRMIDALGRIMFTQEITTANCQLSTANYTPGVYVLQLTNGEKAKTQKIVIE